MWKEWMEAHVKKNGVLAHVIGDCCGDTACGERVATHQGLFWYAATETSRATGSTAWAVAGETK
jgi:hypothetical protein